MPKLTEKQLAHRADDLGLAIWPRYDANGRRIYDVCARDAQGRPDPSRAAKDGIGLVNREAAAFLAGVAYREALGWEDEDGDA